jgi:hypothetical protein
LVTLDPAVPYCRVFVPLISNKSAKQAGVWFPHDVPRHRPNYVFELAGCRVSEKNLHGGFAMYLGGNGALTTVSLFA